MALPIIGHEFRVVGNPELRFTPAGAAICSFRAVADKKKKNEQSGEWEDDKVLWVTVNAWRELAENVVESVKDKDLVVVSGEIHTRQFQTKEGEKRMSVEIEATSVGPSLRFVVTQSRQGAQRASSSRGQQQRPQQNAPREDAYASAQGGQQGGGSWGPQSDSDEPPF
jgi:single-strand DNA-binding protein